MSGPGPHDSLKHWLSKPPQPAAIIADGQRIDVPLVGKARWQDLMATIETLEACKLVAVDANGKVIRGLVLAEKENTAAVAAPEAPGPGMGQLAVFARLLAEAYDNGAKSTAAAYRAIFEENTKLVKLIAERLTRVEHALEASNEKRAALLDELASSTEPEPAADGGMGELVGSLVQGALAAQAHGAAAPPPPTPLRGVKP